MASVLAVHGGGSRSREGIRVSQILHPEIHETLALEIGWNRPRRKLFADDIQHGRPARGAAGDLAPRFLRLARVEMKAQRATLVLAQGAMIQFPRHLSGDVPDHESDDLVVDAA